MPGTTTAGALRRVPLFSRLSEEQLAWISNKCMEVYLVPGEQIASQGDSSDGSYVILEGHTEWTREVGGREVHSVTLGPGEVFAELILFLDIPYPTTGCALDEIQLFKLEPDAFWEMLAICPQVLRGVLTIAAERSQIHESASQQQARLISLGNMAAGLAHELNNPAAASRRAVRELRESVESGRRLAIELGRTLSPEELETFARLEREATARAATPPSLDALERGDLEDEISGWLEDCGVEGILELSPTLVDAGLDTVWLAEVEAAISDDALGSVLQYFGATVATASLLGEAEAGVRRISTLVEAAKSYSNMDRAPLMEVDVNEGIEQTLAVLAYKLGPGIEIEREYDPDLPRITAYGGELNQVWTNLIDNAIDAVDGNGLVKLRTTCEGDGVLVEVTDDGPGVPEDIQVRVFEPFYTTKGVGAGVGLGLDVSYRIVVGRHGGDIRVVSKPGDTRFQVRLPLAPGDPRDGIERGATREIFR